MFVQVFAHEEDLSDAILVLGGTFSLPPGIGTSTAWLTTLNLQTNFADFEDLVSLSSIRSLAVLILNAEPPMLASRNRVVDDRLIRIWSRSAQEAGAFPNLRIVSFHRCQYLTAQCLEFLSKIKALAWTIFHNCHGVGSENDLPQESITTVQKEWLAIDLQNLRDPHRQSESILRLRKLPDLEHYAWLDWYKEETKRLAESNSLLEKQSYLSNAGQGSKPMLLFFCGRQPLALDYPVVFRKMESRHDMIQSPSSIIPHKRPTEHQTTSKNTKRQMKGGKIQNADLSQFF